MFRSKMSSILTVALAVAVTGGSAQAAMVTVTDTTFVTTDISAVGTLTYGPAALNTQSSGDFVTGNTDKLVVAAAYRSTNVAGANGPMQMHWNGAPMTLAVYQNSGSETDVEIWYIDAPAAEGTLTIDASAMSSGVRNGVFGIFSLTGTADGGPEAADGDPDASVTLTGVTEGAFVAAGFTFGTNGTMSIDAPLTTLRVNPGNRTATTGVGYGIVASDGNYTASATNSSTTEDATAAASFAAAPEPPAGTMIIVR